VVTHFRLNQNGVAHAPMLLALFCAALAGFGIWGTLRHWRHVTETQLRLDRCVGQSAQELKTTLVRLDFTNRRIKELRIAIIPAPPPLQIPLRASLELAAGFQEYLLLKWKAKQVLWMAHRGCLEFSAGPKAIRLNLKFG
jgi:hypothetical protein